jgi:Ni,Fe-hydrogenase I small subunit
MSRYTDNPQQAQERAIEHEMQILDEHIKSYCLAVDGKIPTHDECREHGKFTHLALGYRVFEWKGKPAFSNRMFSICGTKGDEVIIAKGNGKP